MPRLQIPPSLRFAATLSFAILAAMGAPPPRVLALSRSDVLVLRGRAGLPRHVRRALVAAQGAEELHDIAALGAVVVRVPHDRLAGVERALRRSGYFKTIERDARAVAADVPDDPEYHNQWGLPKIGAPAAWDLTHGSDSIVVAVLDTGVDASQVDLQNQVVSGYDLANDDADPSDDNGHGTRMAGIIAAQGFNGIGVSGVAPNCKLMPVKVLGADGSGAYSTIVSGITYAADHGARVINLSLAGSAASPALQSAVDYATARGAIVVAAGGNYGSTDPVYPAACANAVGIGATDADDSIASFSNHGAWISLSAPGVNVLTTNWTGTGALPYVGSSGTSPAAAFASGAFALLLSARPELSSSEAVAVMAGAAHDLGSDGWDPYFGVGRIDVGAALGVSAPGPTPVPTPPNVVDKHPPSVKIISPANNALVYGIAGVDVAAADDVGVTGVDLLADGIVVTTDGAPPFSFVWDTTALSPGGHVLRARGYDAAGNVKLSKAVHVHVTEGVGLAVRHARVAPRRRGGVGGMLSVNALFALPDGMALDTTSNSIGITLSTDRGMVVDSAPQPDALTASTQRGKRFRARIVDANGAIIKVLISRAKRQPNYTLSISGSGVNLADADVLMSLNVSINGAVLSQSLAARTHQNAFLFP